MVKYLKCVRYSTVQHTVTINIFQEGETKNEFVGLTRNYSIIMTIFFSNCAFSASLEVAGDDSIPEPAAA